MRGSLGARASSRSLRPLSWSIVSSESIQKIHWPRARRSDSLRAAAKSSHHAKWNTRAPSRRASWAVRSWEPVSTTTISSTHGLILAREVSITGSLSRTIMHSESTTGLAASKRPPPLERRSVRGAGAGEPFRSAPPPGAAPQEGAVAKVVHEGGGGVDGPPAGLDRPAAEIIVLKIAQAEPFVQESDLVQHRAANEQAESHQAVGVHGQAPMALAPLPGEAVQIARVLVAGCDLLRAADRIGARSGQTDAPIAIQGLEQAREPPGRNDHVVIEQQHLLAAGGANPLIASGGKAAVVRVLDEPHVALGPQPLGRVIAGAVVDYGRLIGLVRAEADALQTGLGVGQLVVRDEDDRRQAVAGPSGRRRPNEVLGGAELLCGRAG